MINYDDKLNERMKRIVKAFNRKASSLQSQGRKAPSKVSVVGIKGSFKDSSRNDLESYLTDLERFTKRGSEKTQTIRNKVYTNYDIELFKLNLKRERMAIHKEIESATTYDPVMPKENDAYSQQLLNKVKLLDKNWQELIRNERSYNMIMGKKSSIRQTKSNYLDTLFYDAETLGYDADKIDEMKRKLSKLSNRGIQYLLENEPLAKAVFDYYHTLTRGEDFDYDMTPYDIFDSFYENLDYIISRYK